MQRWMAAHAVPRGSLAVTFDNRLVFAAGYGGRGVNERVPVWSLSKAITALCVASLIKDGRLRLDHPIGPHLARAFERFGKRADKRLAQVTVGQLLSHRGGIPRAVDDNMFAPGLVQLLREHPLCEARIEMLLPLCEARIEMLLPQILRASLVRTPGSEFEYTNMGYLLLGQIIEALTGQSYEVACTERILAAAGIKSPASIATGVASFRPRRDGHSRIRSISRSRASCGRSRQSFSPTKLPSSFTRPIVNG